MNDFKNDIINIINEIKPINQELINSKYVEYYEPKTHKRNNNNIDDDKKVSIYNYCDEILEVGSHDPFNVEYSNTTMLKKEYKKYSKIDKMVYSDKMKRLKPILIKRTKDNTKLLLKQQSKHTINNNTINNNISADNKTKVLNQYVKSVDCDKISLDEYNIYEQHNIDDDYNNIIDDENKNLYIKSICIYLFKYLSNHKYYEITLSNRFNLKFYTDEKHIISIFIRNSKKITSKLHSALQFKNADNFIEILNNLNVNHLKEIYYNLKTIYS